MPIERITERRAKYLSRRVKKVTALKGGFTRLIREAHVYSNTVSNAVAGKCLNVSNAIKLESYLDEQGIKPLSETYLVKKVKLLSDKVIADLERESPRYTISCSEDGEVSETIELSTENFFIEFDIDGRLKFYRKSNLIAAETRNPEKQIDIEPELYIMSIAVWDEDGRKYEIEEKDFEKKLTPTLLDLLEETW